MRRKHITSAAIPQTDLENLYALVDSLDELVRSLEPRAMSADARYLLTDLQKELEDAMLERGVPLFNESLADHIPMVMIVDPESDDDDTRPTLFAEPEDALNHMWSIAVSDAFGDTVDDAPPADDDTPDEAATS